MAKKRGALAKDPPIKTTPVLRGEARREAQAKARGETPPPKKEARQEGVPTRADNKALYDAMTPEQQARYRKIRGNKGVKEANTYLNKIAPKPPQGNEPPPITPEQITEEGFIGAGEAYQGVVDRFQEFDPYQMQQQYEPGFQQEMDRARQNVMEQFERRNQRQFEQQRTSLQQQIAERGLDPASPAAQELMRQQNEREDMAKQEAMSAAEQAAYSVQQQGFGQAGQLAMMPYEQWQAIQQPYIAGIGAQYGQQQQEQQQDWQARQAELDRRNQRWMLRNQPRGGGGGGGGQQGPNLYERMEAEALGRGYNQGQQVNPGASLVQGIAAGVGQGIGRYIAS
jgi:hypothetical protein